MLSILISAAAAAAFFIVRESKNMLQADSPDSRVTGRGVRVSAEGRFQPGAGYASLVVPELKHRSRLSACWDQSL